MIGISLGVSFLLGIGLGTAGVLLVAALTASAWISGKSGPALTGLVLLVALLGALRSPDPAPQVVATYADPNASLVGVVDSYPATTSMGQRFTLTVDDDPPGRETRYCVRSTNTAIFGKGAVVRATGSTSGLNDLPAPTRSALMSRSCNASFETSSIVMLEEPSKTQNVLNRIRNRIATVFQRAAPGDTGSLMTGLVTGDDSTLSFEARSAFLATGTTHITAVSGANFAVLIAVAAAVAGNSGARRRVRWSAAMAAIIWFYATLVGLPPSAMRAALMATFALIAVRF